MEINITEEGNIGEHAGTEDLLNQNTIAYLENQKTEAIRNEILAAFEKAKELNADVFGFGDELHEKYPKEFGKMEADWDEVFRSIELDIRIEAKIRLMGRINNTIISE
jgi:hypothetical protein